MDHIRHIEDLIFYEGPRGANNSISILRDILAKIRKGSKDPLFSISVKWDGSPAVVIGTDPSDAKFFVATKSIFNKDPSTRRIFKNLEEIADSDLNEELRSILSALYTGFKKKWVPGRILQGDVMFGPSGPSMIDSRPAIHGNTLVYFPPPGGKMEEEIQKSDIGIVFHTILIPLWGDLEILNSRVISPKFTPKCSSDNIWIGNPYLGNIKGSMTKAEIQECLDTLEEADGIWTNYCVEFLSQVWKDENGNKYPKALEAYINTFIRGTAADESPTAKGMISLLRRKSDERIKALKTERGKANSLRRFMEDIDSFFSSHEYGMDQAFRVHGMISSVKDRIINSLDRLSPMETFVLTQSGLSRTKGEGFVVNWHGVTTKLVDRMEFSRNNFSPEVTKAWETSLNG